jgi:tetratricopeptide (TPR) repeat protein
MTGFQRIAGFDFSVLRLIRIFLFCLAAVAIRPAAAPSQTNSATDDAYRQATAAMRAGRLDDAATGFQAVLKTNPGLAEVHFNLGLVYQQQGKYEDAIASFQKALALKPHLRGGNLFAGLSEYRLNHYDAAATALQKETTLYPKDAPAWMWLGVVRLAQEKPEEAVEALDKAAKLDPQNADILYHRGRAHLLVSKDSYTQMFKLDPNSWRVHQVLAQTNAESEHHDEAVLEYLEAIKLVPMQPGLHEELGSEYRILGKIPEAETAFRKELEIDPANVLAQYKLGVILVEKGEAVEGKRRIEAALKARPNLRNSDYNLGRAEMQLGDDQTALADFKKAVTGNSEPEIIRQSWYQLGTILRRMHRAEEAQVAFANFQKLKDQEEEDAQRRKQNLVHQRQELNEQDAPQGETAKPQ